MLQLWEMHGSLSKDRKDKYNKKYNGQEKDKDKKVENKRISISLMYQRSYTYNMSIFFTYYVKMMTNNNFCPKSTTFRFVRLFPNGRVLYSQRLTIR